MTAALDVLFETMLLECCGIIVVFGLPALPFPWQVQHQRLFPHSTKAKVNGQTAVCYAARQVSGEGQTDAVFAMGCGGSQGCC